MKCATIVPEVRVENPEARIFDVGSLWGRLASLPDARHRRGVRYPLAVILVLAILAKLGGEDRPSGIADWVRQRAALLREALRLPGSTLPHANTYRRVLGEVVDAADLDAAVGEFLRGLPGVGRSVVVSIDGKTVRGTIGTDHPRGEHLLAAYLPEEGIVLMQVRAGEKENEISVAPTLLKSLDLRGKVVIGDALHTQRVLSAQILEAGGDYVWFVKDNQPTLRADIAQVFVSPEPTPEGGIIPTDWQSCRIVTKGHGRKEIRTITVSQTLNDYSDWPGMAQVFQLERQRTVLKDQKTTTEIVHGLTSRAPDLASPRVLLDWSRTYWGIENGLHHRRDVTFQEDQTRMTRGRVGRVMAILNNLVISLLRYLGETNLAHARRKYAADAIAAVTLVSTVPARL